MARLRAPGTPATTQRWRTDAVRAVPNRQQFDACRSLGYVTDEEGAGVAPGSGRVASRRTARRKLLVQAAARIIVVQWGGQLSRALDPA